MPWPHCDLQVSDDVACPKCGISKQEWTLKVQVTRVFRLGGKALKVELKDQGGGYAGGARYRIQLPDGSTDEGQLNPAGYVKAKSRQPGDATVSFPQHGPEVTALTDGARPGSEAGAFLCAVGEVKWVFQVGSWIELLVKDDGGRPFAREPYVLRLDDQAIEGALDDQGFARVTGLRRGAWRVTFPERDQRETPRSEPEVAWLEVQASDDAGRALADEPIVVLLPDGAAREATLDERGFVRLEGLPPGRCRVRFPRRERLPKVEVPDARAWLEVLARDDRGAPLADEPYEVLLPDGATRTGRLDARGFARLDDLPEGRCRVRFPERADSAANVVAPPPSAWLEVRAQDEQGRPLPDEPYEVLLPDGATRAGRLDARGFARLEGLEPGRCRVRFPAREVAPSAPPPPPATAWLAFAAHDESGRPCADEPYVVLFPDGSSRAGRLDAQGRARLEGVRPGPCRVRFPEREVAPSEPPPPPATAWLAIEASDEAGRPCADERYVVLCPDGTTREGALDAQGRARLDGLPEGRCRVRFPAREATPPAPQPAAVAPPAAWLDVEALDEAGRPRAEEPYVVLLSDGTTRAGTLDAQGRARLEGLPPGRCRVRFPEQQVVPLPPPPPPPARTAWLELEAVDEAGAARANEAYVVLAPDGTTREGTLDASGRARLEGLPQGRCRVRFPAADAPRVPVG